VHISLQYIAVLFVDFSNAMGNVSVYNKFYSFRKPNDSVTRNVHGGP